MSQQDNNPNDSNPGKPAIASSARKRAPPSSRRGGPDILPEDDSPFARPGGRQHSTQASRSTDDGIPELFPETQKRSQFAEREMKRAEKERAQGASASRQEKAGVKADVPELVPDTPSSQIVASASATAPRSSHQVDDDALLKEKEKARAGLKTSSVAVREVVPDTVSSQMEVPGATAQMAYQGNEKPPGKGTPQHSKRSDANGKLKKTRGKGSGRARQMAPGMDIEEDDIVQQQALQMHESSSTTQGAAVRPGAVAVRGFNASADDASTLDDGYIIGDERTVASSSPQRTSTLPQAQTVDDEEEGLFEDLAAAELVPESELKEQERQRGVMGWIRQHKVLTLILILVVIGAVVGGVVGATAGGGGGSDIAQPSSAPSMFPTAAPTFDDFQKVAPTLSKITPLPILTNPNTPQNAAVNWLLNQDGHVVDFDNEAKLLQRYALVTIYFATNGPNWISQLNFLTDQDECLWSEDLGSGLFGVQTCNDQGLVVDLQLSQNGLGGTLPNEVVGLEALVFISAAFNNMSGTIPDSLFSLLGIDDIRLFENNFGGTLSNAIGNLVQLTHLAIQTNNLVGTLPSSLGQATDFINLFVNANQFVGTLPTELGVLGSLQEFQLAENQFIGTIPTEYSGMTSLLVVRLEQNNLNGSAAPLCVDTINFNALWMDCLEIIFPGLPTVEPEVDCPCCTFCCSNDGTCLANTPG